MVRKISLFDLPGSKVGLRDAEAASQKFETPLLFCHFQRRLKIFGLRSARFWKSFLLGYLRFGFAVFADEALEYLGDGLGLCAAEL